MDAPVYKKLTDLEKLHENPQQNVTGQVPVSITDDFYSRLWKEGRPRNNYSQGTTLPANTYTGISTLKTSPGCIMYPTAIVISTDVNAMVTIQYNTKILDAGLSSDGQLYDVGYITAGTPFIIYPKGMAILEGGDISIHAKSTVAGNIYGSIQAVEVTV